MSLQLEQYDQFWADYLGIKPSEWDAPGVSVNAHAGLAGYCGVWFFSRRERLVISAPPGWLNHIRECVQTVQLHGTNLEQNQFQELFGESFDRSIGPVFQGALMLDRFSPVESQNVRELTSRYSEPLKTFRAECTEDEIVTSGINKTTQYQAAFFDGGRIVAVSGYRPLAATIGDPCVLTHPEYRNRGCGVAVTSMTVRLALNDEKVLLYQTLESNVAAMRLAYRLGYDRYAQHIAVRLKTDAPST